jgi:hypothetical protein
MVLQNDNNLNEVNDDQSNNNHFAASAAANDHHPPNNIAFIPIPGEGVGAAVVQHPPPAPPAHHRNHNNNENNNNGDNNVNNDNPNRNLLQDLDGWLESNGLRSIEDVLQDDTSVNIQKEELHRIQEEQRYVKSIHHKAFYKDIIQKQKERAQKQQIIQSYCRNYTMEIRTYNNEMIYDIPLHRMANVCDTIFTMVQNKALWEKNHHPLPQNHRHTLCDESNPNRKGEHTSSSSSFLHLSLETYFKSTVQEFVNLCLSYDSDSDSDDDLLNSSHDENTNVKHKNYSSVHRNLNNSGSHHDCQRENGDHTSSLSSSPPPKSSPSSIIQVLQDIPDDAIILDCCRIGHYLLAQPIVDLIVNEVLIPSIDTSNCFTLYQLADELNLTSSTLLQRTLSHMIHSIGEYSPSPTTTTTNMMGTKVNDNEDEWNNDLYQQELNERLQTMKHALESSVHGGNHGSGSNKQLYFSSMEEYLSIFAERVQYYRERLHEAKECQKQQQQEQQRSSFTIRGRVIPSSYVDAETKIQKQEHRVRTLEIAYAEQKALFCRRSSSNSK